MDWKRDSYYTTRSWVRVRLIYIKEDGDMVFIYADGTTTKRGPNGECYPSKEFSAHDITGPWVEPVKSAECWEVHRAGAFVGRFDTERKAEVYLQRVEGFYPERVGEYRVVHMREVLP